MRRYDLLERALVRGWDHSAPAPRSGVAGQARRAEFIGQQGPAAGRRFRLGEVGRNILDAGRRPPPGHGRRHGARIGQLHVAVEADGTPRPPTMRLVRSSPGQDDDRWDRVGRGIDSRLARPRRVATCPPFNLGVRVKFLTQCHGVGGRPRRKWAVARCRPRMGTSTSASIQQAGAGRKALLRPGRRVAAARARRAGPSFRTWGLEPGEKLLFGLLDVLTVIRPMQRLLARSDHQALLDAELVAGASLPCSEGAHVSRNRGTSFLSWVIPRARSHGCCGRCRVAKRRRGWLRICRPGLAVRRSTTGMPEIWLRLVISARASAGVCSAMNG